MKDDDTCDTASKRVTSSLKLKCVCAALTFTTSMQIYIKVHKVLTPTHPFKVDVVDCRCTICRYG